MERTGLNTAGGGVTQQELESRLWAAANSLRGSVDAADFKAYIFPLLFFKRISDAWDDEHDAAVAEYGPSVDPEVEADFHPYRLPDGTHWADLRRLTGSVGAGLQTILDRVQAANPDALAGIFGDVQWANRDRLDDPALLGLVAAFDRLDLRPSRIGHRGAGDSFGRSTTWVRIFS